MTYRKQLSNLLLLLLIYHSAMFVANRMCCFMHIFLQTAKKLPAFGCKVFQVKELVHGRTLRKVGASLVDML